MKNHKSCEIFSRHYMVYWSILMILGAIVLGLGIDLYLCAFTLCVPGFIMTAFGFAGFIASI